MAVNPASNYLTMSFETVSIHVEGKSISVYKDLLTAVSPYFHKAFNGPFKEAGSRSVVLEDVSEQTFRMFIHWAYVQSLQFDTSSAALDHSALLPPDEADKVAKLVNEDAQQSEGIKEDAADDQRSTLNDANSTVGIDDTTKGPPIFDEEVFHNREENKHLMYHANNTWKNNTDLFDLSMAKLFIFADKYDVAQLRDDIMTAFIGQCWRWNWWPGEDLADLVCGSLPATSKFANFLACSIAWVSIVHRDANVTGTMQFLRDRWSDLAFSVGTMYAENAHAHQHYKVSVCMSDNLGNSCRFHDHSVLNEEQCRKRMAKKPHIFTAILDACAKDALAATT